MQQARTVRAVELLRENHIESVVIKGAAAMRYYPPDVFRPSVDVDLAVSAADFPAAQAVITSPAAAGMAIDLHDELRHLDVARWEYLTENSVELDLPEGKVRALRPEDDLRVLAVHWLTDGGVHKQRLWDVTYLVGSHRNDLDWAAVVAPLPTNRRRWLECTLGLAARYTGLDLEGTPFEGAADRLPKWLVRTVEAEWAAETKPWPLEASLGDRRLLLAQIKRRLRPNPIYATVDCEGDFDASTRFFYRLRNGIRRVMPSYRRVSYALRQRLQDKR
jgi:hypothetical protein